MLADACRGKAKKNESHQNNTDPRCLKAPDSPLRHPQLCKRGNARTRPHRSIIKSLYNRRRCNRRCHLLPGGHVNTEMGCDCAMPTPGRRGGRRSRARVCGKNMLCRQTRQVWRYSHPDIDRSVRHCCANDTKRLERCCNKIGQDVQRFHWIGTEIDLEPPGVRKSNTSSRKR